LQYIYYMSDLSYGCTDVSYNTFRLCGFKAQRHLERKLDISVTIAKIIDPI